MTLEELQILITTETAGLKKELNNVKKEMSGLDKSVGKATESMKKAFKGVAVALATLGIGKYVKDSIKAASDLEGAFLGLQSIVEGQGRSFSKAKGFINDYVADGLVPLTDAVNAYKNLAARGYNDEQIQQVMERLKDAAAFGRQSSYTLGQAVASATEGLKNENSILVDNAGVTKNVAKMWDEYAASIGKTANNLTQQEKIQAEVNGIMQETKFQVGDAAKYSDTLAGRLAMLSKTFADIRVNVGQAFTPIANYVIPILQKLANWLVRVTTYFKYFMQAFFGVSSAQKQVTAAVGGGTAAQESYGTAAQKAGSKVKKAAAEAKGSVAGFDEINSLADKTSEATDGGGSGGGTDPGVGGIGADMGFGDFEMPEVDTETIPKNIQAMADRVKGSFKSMWESIKDFGSLFNGSFSGIRSAIQPLYDAVEPIKVAFAEIGRTAIELVNNFLRPVAGYFLFDFIPSLVIGITQTLAPLFADIAINAVQVFSKTFKNVSDTVTSLWNSTWFPSIERLKVSFLDSFKSIGGSLQNLLNNTIRPFVDYALNGFIIPIAKKINEVLVPIFTDILVFAFERAASAFEWLANIMSDIYKSLIEPVFNFLKKLVMDTLDIVMKLWEKHGKSLLTNLTDLFEGIQERFQLLWDHILKPIVEPFLDALTFLWDKHLKGLIEQVGEFIMKLVNGALEIYNKFIGPLIDMLIKLLGPTFKVAFTLIVDVVTTAVGFLADLIKGIIQILGGLIDFVVGVFTGNWRKAWEGVKDIFAGVFNSLWGIVKFPLNLIIDGINTVIGALNSIKIDIPDWVPVFGGESFGINIPRIPKLARGGIVDGATNFGNYIAGEAGSEMIVPLENTPFVSKLASALGSAVMAAMQMSLAGQQNQQSGDIVINVDGTTFARILNPYLARENKRVGSTIIQPV